MYDNLLANVPTDLWIGGKWRKASDNARFDVIDPATETEGRLGGERQRRGRQGRGRRRAATPSTAGRRSKPRERGEILRKAFELIVRDAERFAKLITIENGKALSDFARRGALLPPSSSAGTPRRRVRNLGEIGMRAVVRRPHPGAAQAGRRRRAGDAVEFPGRDGDAQDRPGAGGRLHGGAQARVRDAAHHARADADPGGGRRAGRRLSTSFRRAAPARWSIGDAA